jgi:exodeoxyribonuclease X
MLPSFIRVVDLETTGDRPPAHGVCEIGWQDVVLGEDGAWALGEGGSTLVDPVRPIPPVTMAVHHIMNDDVAGAPRWGEAAPAVLRAGGGALALAAHRAAFEQRWCTPELTGGADWICTWKCALRLWPDSPGFSNQVLRYWREPRGIDRARALPAHRAGPDAYVTAHHLRDMLALASPAQLIAWSLEPGLLPRVPHGPDRGEPWTALDDTRLASFAADRNADVRFSAEREQARRRGEPTPGRGPLETPQGRLF